VLIQVIGLCAIGDPTVVGGSTAKTILLVNHSKDRSDPHTARFIVNYKNLPPNPQDYGFKQLNNENNNPGDFWAYDLTGIEVDLHQSTYDGGNTLKFSDAGSGHNTIVPTFTGNDEDDTSIHWIPSLSRVLGSAPAFQRDYVRDRPDPDAANVSARVPLYGGELAAFFSEAKPIWIYQFREAANPFNYKQIQAIADEIHYSFPLKQNQTEYYVYGRAFGSQDSKPLFKVIAAPAATKIEMFLANAPSNAPFPDNRVKIDIGYTDKHFHKNYDIVSNAVQYEPFVFSRVRPYNASPAGAGVYCGPDSIP